MRYFRRAAIAAVIAGGLLGALGQRLDANLALAPTGGGGGGGIAHVQNAVGSASFGSSFTVSVSAIGAGHMVVGGIMVLAASVTVTGISDGTNTYTLLTSNLPVGGANQFYTFYGHNLTAGPTTITITMSGTNASALGACVDEYSGVTTTGLDGHHENSQATPGTGANALVSGNITTVNASDVIWGFSTHNIAGNTPSVAGTGYTVRNSGNVSTFGFDCLTEDKAVSSTGAYQATATNSTDGGTTSFATAVVGIH